MSELTEAMHARKARELHNFQCIGAWDRHQSQWILRTLDPIEAILTPGYFERHADEGMRHGDRIQIVAGDFDPLLCILADGLFDITPAKGDAPASVTIALLGPPLTPQRVDKPVRVPEAA